MAVSDGDGSKSELIHLQQVSLTAMGITTPLTTSIYTGHCTVAPVMVML